MSLPLFESFEKKLEIILRDYQTEAVEKLREAMRKEVINMVLCSPTGSGKTIIALYLIKSCYDKGKRALFICDRISLIDQTSALLDKYGIPHGIIQADNPRNRRFERIQVASVQTLARRQWPDADLIVVDEAHSMYETIKKKIEKRKTVCIGLTATPFTKGLGKYYDTVVQVRTLQQLTDDGFLVPFRTFAASEPNMEKAKIVGGEWTDLEAEARSMPIVGDCVREYLKHAKGKKFIAFGCTVAHCEELKRQFEDAGIRCEVYSYKTSDNAKKLIMEEFRKTESSALDGLISVAALAKGLDVPDIECIIMARPLRKSLAEHIQILGRGLRISEGKNECIILDHSGNMVRFWDDMTEFFENGCHTLDDGKAKEKKSKKDPQDVKVLKCPICFNVHERSPYCPSCGHVYPKKETDIVHESGTLVELSGMKRRSSSFDDSENVYAQLKWIANERGWKPGAVRHSYKKIYGVFPDSHESNNVPAIPATDKIRNEIKRQLIAYFNSKKSA